ncbi:MAG: multicopper oxidase domain-containing protein, partial [Saprospiraceae bacterium]
THWHGAHVPTFADGGPHQRINPDAKWSFDIQVKDKSATMWYHPHLMGKTYEHVQMGLSGMLYVDDPPAGDDDPILVQLHEILPHDYAINDFPIILQTKKFYNCGEEDEPEQIFTEGFKKDYQFMVNGTMNPYLEVPASMVRLRLLNGDAKFAFSLNLGNEDNSQTEDFELIATDAGYTDRSYSLPNIMMSPGERTEWLVDFRGRAGDTLYLHNVVSDTVRFIPNIIGSKKKNGRDVNLLQIIVTEDQAAISPIIAFPISLHPQEIPAFDENTKERIKVFEFTDFTVGVEVNPRPVFDSLTNECKIVTDINEKNVFSIDNTLMDMTIVNDTVMLGDTEIWTIKNETNDGHPFHIHDIHFHVTKVLDKDGNEIDPATRPAIFAGPKDNVLVEPGWTLSFVTQFNDFGTPIAPQNSYMYHCHILPHEDRGMMGQFVVWDGSVPTNTEETVTTELSVFPNPATNMLFIEGESTQESELRIYDLQGRLLQSQQFAPFSGQQAVDVSQLSKGMLFLEWISGEQRAVSKVVLER